MVVGTIRDALTGKKGMKLHLPHLEDNRTEMMI
jgi:hypothetical protein